MNTSIGKELEETAFEFLRMSGLDRIDRQININGKNVDIYFERLEYGKLTRYAVECKNINTTIDRDIFDRIVGSYQPLINSNAVDRIMIVSNFAPTPNVASSIKLDRFYLHITLNQLRCEIMDFTKYIYGTQSHFLSICNNEIHIPMKGRRISDGNTFDLIRNFESFLEANINSSNAPIAIIGSYGIGKTTIARHLFLSYANRYHAYSSQPIPLYIPLSKLKHEQSLEGLFGHLFGFESPVRGYDFNVFLELNKLRHFIFIFDGLDEMRHMLSWDEFSFNINQISRITKDNPQAIILGRPTAFLNQTEYKSVVYGDDGRPLRTGLNEGVAYIDYELQPFDRSDIEQYIKLSQDKGYISRKGARRLKAIISDSESPQIIDIASRPIQLKMLVDITDQLPPIIDNITVRSIYDLFIADLIRREQHDKNRHFSEAQRRSFVELTAWWLWLRPSGTNVIGSDLPDELIIQVTYDRTNVDRARRDLLMGSFMTSSKGEYISFPHRSAQEFLVSEFIRRDLVTTRGTSIQRDIGDLQVGRIFTHEICDFISAEHLSEAEKTALVLVFEEKYFVPHRILSMLCINNDDLPSTLDLLKRTGNALYGIAILTHIIDNLGSRKISIDQFGHIDTIYLDRNSTISEYTSDVVLNCLKALNDRIERDSKNLGDDKWLVHESFALLRVMYLLLGVKNDGNYAHRQDKKGQNFRKALQHVLDITTKSKFIRHNVESEPDPIVASSAISARGFSRFISENTLKDGHIRASWLHTFLISSAGRRAFIDEWCASGRINIKELSLPYHI